MPSQRVTLGQHWQEKLPTLADNLLSFSAVTTTLNRYFADYRSVDGLDIFCLDYNQNVITMLEGLAGNILFVLEYYTKRQYWLL